MPLWLGAGGEGLGSGGRLSGSKTHFHKNPSGRRKSTSLTACPRTTRERFREGPVGAYLQVASNASNRSGATSSPACHMRHIPATRRVSAWRAASSSTCPLTPTSASAVATTARPSTARVHADFGAGDSGFWIPFHELESEQPEGFRGRLAARLAAQTVVSEQSARVQPHPQQFDPLDRTAQLAEFDMGRIPESLCTELIPIRETKGGGCRPPARE